MFKRHVYYKYKHFSPGGGGVLDQYLGMGDGAAEALKPWPCLGQKIPKIHALFTKTSSIFVSDNSLNFVTRTDLHKSCTLFETDLCDIIYPV